MDVDFDDAESSFIKFNAGERYNLVIQGAEGGENDNGTPFLKIILQTEDGRSAYDHMMYLTPKALYRAQEWFKAMGLSDSGKVKFEPERLAGIRLSAECYLEPYTVNEGTPEQKTYQNTKWCKPVQIKIGGAPAKTSPGGMAKMAPAAAPKQEASSDEVPF